MDKKEILTIIAKNLKNLLNETEILPNDLTKKCEVSAGSLSKIMKAKMSITIPMAMEIAEGLGVDLNDLLAGLTVQKPKNDISSRKKADKTSQFSIGILSINNKRITCIKDRKGNTIGTSELEGGLDLAETSSSLLHLIHESISAACQNDTLPHNKLKSAKLNLVTQSYEFVETRAKFTTFALKHFKEVSLLPDWQISYLSVFENKQGISLITDKGVSLSYLQKGKLHKLGGWKFPVYDLGGENWLGIETIRHTIEAKEGHVPMSDLAQTVLAKYNGKIEKITETCFKNDDADIYCLFADPLYRSYYAHDPAAVAIIEHGFHSVYRLIDRVDEILGKKTKIALSGSLRDIYKPYFDPARLITSSSNAEKASLLADLSKEFLSEHEIY